MIRQPPLRNAQTDKSTWRIGKQQNSTLKAHGDRILCVYMAQWPSAREPSWLLPTTKEWKSRAHNQLLAKSQPMWGLPFTNRFNESGLPSATFRLCGAQSRIEVPRGRVMRNSLNGRDQYTGLVLGKTNRFALGTYSRLLVAYTLTVANEGV